MLTSAPCGNNNPIVRNPILATLCSNPAVINVNKHHQIINILAVSSFSLYAIQVARQTKTLHNKPLKNNSIPGVFIFVATLFTINSPMYSLLPFARPACIYKNAPTTPPIKFPIQTTTQILTASNQVTFFSKAPIVIIIALLVNKSPPHIKTKLKATPKHAPINIL